MRFPLLRLDEGDAAGAGATGQSDAAVALKAVQDQLDAANAELSELRPKAEAVDVMKDRMRAARSAVPEYAKIAEAVLRANYDGLKAPAAPAAPEPGPFPPAAAGDDDLDEHSRRIIDMAREASARAMAEVMEREMAPIRQELRLRDQRDQQREVEEKPYAQRIAERKAELEVALSDPRNANKSIDQVLRELDYPHLYEENEQLKAKLEEREGADRREGERHRRITRQAGPGGGGAVGAAPEVDYKQKYEGQKGDALMRSIMGDVFDEGAAR